MTSPVKSKVIFFLLSVITGFAGKSSFIRLKQSKYRAWGTTKLSHHHLATLCQDKVTRGYEIIKGQSVNFVLNGTIDVFRLELRKQRISYSITLFE